MNLDHVIAEKSFNGENIIVAFPKIFVFFPYIIELFLYHFTDYLPFFFVCLYKNTL